MNRGPAENGICGSENALFENETVSENDVFLCFFGENVTPVTIPKGALSEKENCMLSSEIHEEQKSALKDAAIKLVVENGLENVTARAIGSRSGVNEVYIYRYFESKDDLLAKAFAELDERLLQTILDNFPVIQYESVNYEARCRILFAKCWDFVMAHRDWLIFYVRYYYSAQYQRYSYDAHMKRYEVLIDKVRPACHPTAQVETVLHHILDTMLGQARKQLLHPGDPAQVKEDTFWLLYSVLKCGKGI